jgi:putative transcriptional regulator
MLIFLSTPILVFTKITFVHTNFMLKYAYANKGGDIMMRYYKLFDLLSRRDMKKTDLLEVISAPTLAKLSKGESVTTDVLCKICAFLDCQPGDIMEYIK